jgi:HEAT repeat protein
MLAAVAVPAIMLSVLLAGCGSKKPPAAAPTAARDTADVPPAQVRAMLRSLQSPNFRTQYAALERLSRLPTIAQTYRPQIERLQAESKDDRVRRKAAEVLAAVKK